MSRKPERGQYRSITVVLLDGPQFQDLPAEARWVFVALKCSLGPCGIQVEYPAGLVEKLAGRTGYDQPTVARALDLLQDKGWVRAERNVVWVIGQLQHEPSLSPKNDNHKPMVLAHVKGLPRLGIVGDFIRHCHDYFTEPDELVKAFPKSGEAGLRYGKAIPHPMGDTMGDQRQGQGGATSDTDEVTTTSAGAVELDDPKHLPHSQSSCMRLVVDRLYLGRRPSERDMATNGSILRKYAERYGYDRMARFIEGLALRRDRGELYEVKATAPVSLKWLNSNKMLLNQLAVSEDALYQGNAPPRKGKGGMADAGAVAASIVGRIGP